MALNVYEIITERIITELEKGQIPWEKPWFGVRSGAFNRVSKRPYSLLNQMLLKHQGEYGTYKQWQSLGGTVRKGEKSEIVVFWKPYEHERINSLGEVEIVTVPYLRYYNVFHISQVDGVEPLEQPFNEIEPIAEADRIINEYVAREHIIFNEQTSNEAYYSPLRDCVVVPRKEQFQNVSQYYSVAFHELTHSTGHANRLNRLQSTSHFGSESYSKEELVAEIGSASILNTLGIETDKTFRSSAAYIQNWLQVLKNDSKFIVSASSKAEKAVNYILGTEAV